MKVWNFSCQAGLSRWKGFSQGDFDCRGTLPQRLSFVNTRRKDRFNRMKHLLAAFPRKVFDGLTVLAGCNGERLRTKSSLIAATFAVQGGFPFFLCFANEHSIYQIKFSCIPGWDRKSGTTACFYIFYYSDWLQ